MNHLDPEILQHFKEDEKHQLAHEEDMHKISSDMALMHEKLDKFIIRSEPVVIFFEGMTFSKKMIMFILGFIAAVGSLILMWKNIFK